ncbi:MAG: YggS family pyridoxal phosphate-dependent enzyme [Desulfobulbaceae bacterium]|jgi:pyridoxal phosphate enzyme (YggS family)|nr:YggS family pyridoxal phosphate-dependent enzyme [Desulfobulbaceae bacterium]
MSIAGQLQKIHRKIAESATRCCRHPGEISLLAVSKTVSVDSIREAAAAGQRIFGENYLQEAEEKYRQLSNLAEFHCIGHIQSNKAKIAATIFSMVQTIDREKIARELNKHRQAVGKPLAALVQVNVGGEEQKSGVKAEDCEKFLFAIQELPWLRVTGLMTIPPYSPNPEDSRPFFRELRQLAATLAAKKLFAAPKVELSMGMSGDFAVAIEEGATIIRVGTALFGER